MRPSLFLLFSPSLSLLLRFGAPDAWFAKRIVLTRFIRVKYNRNIWACRTIKFMLVSVKGTGKHFFLPVAYSLVISDEVFKTVL